MKISYSKCNASQNLNGFIVEKYIVINTSLWFI